MEFQVMDSDKRMPPDVSRSAGEARDEIERAANALQRPWNAAEGPQP